MKKTFFFIPAVVLLFATGCNNNQKHEEQHDATPMATDTVSATTTENTSEDLPMDSAAMAKAWEAYMTPGEMHKWLASTDGKWDAEFTFWEGKDAPPQSGTKAKAEFKTILDGKYQQSSYKGDMFGMPFEGQGITAYDNAKKKFITTWIDNMGTGMMYMEGTYDEPSKSISFAGKGVDPMTGKEVTMREVLELLMTNTR
jgi:hypothetical protein